MTRTSAVVPDRVRSQRWRRSLIRACSGRLVVESRGRANPFSTIPATVRAEMGLDRLLVR